MRTIDALSVLMLTAGIGLLVIIILAINTGRAFGIAGGILQISFGLIIGSVILYCTAGDEKGKVEK